MHLLSSVRARRSPHFLKAIGRFRDFNRDGVIDWRDLEVESERLRFLQVENGRATCAALKTSRRDTDGRAPHLNCIVTA